MNSTGILRTPVLFLIFFLRGVLIPAQPAVVFTAVPDWGTNAPLEGRISNTTLADHGVAIYIFVEEAGGWWNKPTSAQPVTLPAPDSTFSASIVTGGLDQFATRIAAFLVPTSFSPPILSGGELPASIFTYPYAIHGRPHGNRQLLWAGQEWTVKRSVGPGPLPVGPGPNIFSDHDTMVWVDDQQRLHLRIARKGNQWHCSEVIGNTPQGYGRYNFRLSSRFDLLDPNVIAGMFTWDDLAPFEPLPDQEFREIDFEFTRWGDPENDNAQFVIQPYTFAANIHRFNIDLSGTDLSEHWFDWSPDSVYFRSIWGASEHTWNYTIKNGIPQPGEATVRINLHLLRGNAPTDGKAATLVLDDFSMSQAESASPTIPVRIHPNPFSEECTITLSGWNHDAPEILIMDMHGDPVRRLKGGDQRPGTIRWNGFMENGEPAPAGIYLIRIICQGAVSVLKAVKL